MSSKQVNRSINANTNNKAKRNATQSAPVAYSQKQNFPSNGIARSKRFSGSELIGTIPGSVSFSAVKYVINPGIDSSFPWLSVMAKQWQQYHFHKLCYRFVTRTATAEKGSIILSPDYNPRDLPPSTEANASNTMDAVENVVWANLECKLDPQAMHPNGPRKQIRSTNVPGDLNLYDAGNMFVCTTGEDDTADIGKLWVDYDVELFVPQNSPDGSTGAESMTVLRRLADQTFATGVSAYIDFSIGSDENPLGITEVVAGIYTIPAGTYRLCGSFPMNNTVNEAFSASVTATLNGSSVITFSQAVSTATYHTLAIVGVFNSTGGDTLELGVTLTGATGVLKLKSPCFLTLESI